MDSNQYKVLITTSGVGQRLGEFTKYTNKSLVRVGKRPALSYVIDAYPKDVEIVLTLGHFGNHVREFIGMAYPDRKFTFVEVDDYQGPGSSLGYSMLKAKDYLQCPFIYHASDTIVDEPITAPDENWNGGTKYASAASYSSFNVLGGNVSTMNEKGALNYDLIHIALVGIKDHQAFWEILQTEYDRSPEDQSLNDCRAIKLMIDRGLKFKAREFKTWLDTGNTESLNVAKHNVKDQIVNLDKNDEAIFIFDDFVIKFFHDQELVRQRAARAKNLAGLVPELEKTGVNFYRYRYAEGELYSEAVTPSDFSRFLEWVKSNLWKPVNEVDGQKFKETCRKFYYDKTLERVEKFLAKNSLRDETTVINGETIPPLKELLAKVDFEKLAEGLQSKFHGDFILDNIIKTSDSYILLDWRQNFGGLLEGGDMYYDLAKLNHNLTVNHGIIQKDLFTVGGGNGTIDCDIMRKDVLVKCQEILHQFIIRNGWDLKKVKLLTAIIWLNMSPLHHHPFNIFLYYFGKYNLWRTLNQQ